MSSQVKDRRGWRRMPMQWRAATIGALALAVVVAMFSIAPAREAMAQFLGIFRVQSFAPISVEPERVAQLESLHDALESGVLGEPTVIREPDRPQPVADVAAAEAAAGFDVREPAELPEGASRQEMSVGVGPHVKLDVERSKLEAVLAIAGMQDITLPPFDTATVDVDIPAMVAQRYSVTNPYGDRNAKFSLVQAPSPSVNLPAGIDPAAMGEVFLLVLGVDPANAHRMAQAIDWTSTLVVPFPADMGSFSEIEVDGVQGLLLEQSPRSPDYRRAKVLMWQRDGMVYALESENMATSAMTEIADSLK